MKLSKFIEIYDPETDEEKKVVVEFNYSFPQSRFAKFNKDPADYAEVEIIKFTDKFGNPLGANWDSIVANWEKKIENITDLLNYAEDVD